MKILFYTNSIYSFGGVQRVLAVVAKALSEEHDVTILTLDDPSREDPSMYGLDDARLRVDFMGYRPLPKVEHYVCKAVSALYKKVLPKTECTSSWYAWSSFAPTYRKQLTDYINQGHYDVVVGVHVFLAMHIASIKDRISAKTVGWLHNCYEAMFEKQSPYVPRELWQFCKIQLHRLERVVVLSDTDCYLFQKKMQLSTTRIYNPLTIEPQGVCTPSAKRFLSIGRMENGHKGFDILVEAFALFTQSNSEWQLDVVGEGPEQESLQALIESNQLGDRVHLHPFTKDVGAYYRQSSVYVLSSRWEGMPLVLMEALSYGLPVVASDIQIVKELLDGKSFATICTCGDPASVARGMQRWAAMEDMAQENEAAMDYAHSFQQKQIAEKWNEMFRAL